MNEQGQEKDRDLISSEDVLAVVNGDQKALVEQLEKARALAEEQLRNSHTASLTIDEQKRIADNLRKKEEELALAKQKEQEDAELAKLSPAERKKLEKAKAKKAKEEAKRLKKLARQQKISLEQARKKMEKEKKKANSTPKPSDEKADSKATLEQAALVSGASANTPQVVGNRPFFEQRPDVQNEKNTYSSSNVNTALSSSQVINNTNNVNTNMKKVEQKPVVPPSGQVTPTTNVVGPGAIMNQKQTIKTVVPNGNLVNKVSTAPTPKAKANGNTNAANNPQNPNNKNTRNKPKEKSSGNFKYYLTFIFFAFLIWMVAFLPEITQFVSNYFDSLKSDNNILTTGVLTCTLANNDDKYDYYYEADFSFRDSKMYRLIFNTTIKGDQHLDAVELSEMRATCDLLEEQTDNLRGIKVSCSLTNGVYENEQQIEYADIDVEKLTSAYMEAGGTYPNYQYEQSIDDIEKEMKSSNYTCERHS